MPTFRMIACVGLALACPPALAPAQWGSQQDARILPVPNDLSYGDRFGGACDLDGSTLIVGASWHDPFGTSDAYGAAYVFVRTPSGWVQEAKLASSSHDAGDRFGYSVAVQGDRAVVGAAYDENPGAAASGAVFVFERSAGTWSESARLTASDLATFDHFGSSVALDGDTVAVGAEFDNAGTGSFGGSAYVFVKSGSSWVQQAKLVAPAGAANDHMGTSIALEGDRAVVGAPGHDGVGMVDAGAVYVFERVGAAWSLTAQLAPADSAAGDEFGAAVALDGATILAGAPHKLVIGTNEGAAYVFVGAGAAWVQEARLVDLGFAFADQFGSAVDLEGDRAVVGLPFSNAAGIATGGVQFFERQAGTWTALFEMVGSSCEGGDYLGTSVAISGTLVASGAEWGETPPAELATGEAYVFELTPPPFVVSYCTSKLNSLGCAPTMGWSGAPSASNPNPFTLTCASVLNYKSGICFYGLAAAAVPFQGGTMCVAPPRRRTPVQHSGGNSPPAQDCTGTFAYDMNARIQSGVDPSLVPGAEVFAQYWSRDPNGAFTTSLSDAIHFRIYP